MKRIILPLALLLAALLSTAAFAAAPELTVDKDGTASASGSEGSTLYLASYAPATGRFLGLLSAGAGLHENTALKAMQTDAGFAPKSEAATALVITEPNATITGGSYGNVVVTQSASGAVTLDSVTVAEQITVYGGNSLALQSCKVPKVEVDTAALAVTTADMTKPSITTALDTPPSVTVDGAAQDIGSGTLTLALDTVNHKLTVDFNKPSGYTGFGLYCYDKDNKLAGYSAIYDNFNALVVLPCAPESGKYSFAVKGWGTGVTSKELARLDDCIEVTVSGDPLAYTAEFTGGQNTDKYTVSISSDLTGGLMLMHQWFNGEGYIRASGGAGGVSATGTFYNNRTLEEGDELDLRMITGCQLDGQTLKVSMTPASTKTYSPALTLAVPSSLTPDFNSQRGLYLTIGWPEGADTSMIKSITTDYTFAGGIKTTRALNPTIKQTAFLLDNYYAALTNGENALTIKVTTQPTEEAAAGYMPAEKEFTYQINYQGKEAIHYGGNAAVTCTGTGNGNGNESQWALAASGLKPNQGYQMKLTYQTGTHLRETVTDDNGNITIDPVYFKYTSCTLCEFNASVSGNVVNITRTPYNNEPITIE